MTLSDMVLELITEGVRPRVNLGRSELARKARQKLRKKVKGTLLTWTVNDLMRMVNNRKKLLGSEMGDMRVFKLVKTSPNPKSNQIVFHGESRGTKLYKDSVSFYKVNYSDVKTKKFPLTVTMPSNKISYMEQLKSNFNPIQTRCNCFTGDTLIPLLDGYSVPIKDLVGKKEFYVYSYDIEKCSIEVGKAFNCRKTGEKVPVIEVTFDNGNKIKCTSDHKFLMRDGSYKEVQYIKEGESLKPLYRRESKGKNCNRKDYELVCQGQGWQNWEATHWLSDRYNVENNLDTFKGENFARHHKDFNKRNNRPDNIERLDFYKHVGNHKELARRLALEAMAKGEHPFQRKELIEQTIKRMLENNPMTRSNTVKKVKQTNLEKGTYKRTSERMIRHNPMKDSKTVDKVVRANKENGNYIGAGYYFRASDPDVRKKMKASWTTAKKARQANRMKAKKLLGTHPFQNLTEEQLVKKYEKRNLLKSKQLEKLETWISKLPEIFNIRLSDILGKSLGYSGAFAMKSHLKELVKLNNYLGVIQLPKSNHTASYFVNDKVMNHKIVNIKEVGYEDVYCMEVDKYHNFAIDVDNGKDCSSGVFVHNCLDFKMRWAFYSKKKKALLGKAFPKYTRKTTTWPEVNPSHVPGFCKHILGLLNRLKKDRILI